MVVRFVLIEIIASRHLLGFAETLKPKENRKTTSICHWRSENGLEYGI
jgi:hypothetical protein